MIAWFGTGLLGSGFVRAALARGEKVHVWNRSLDKARALEQHGARAFDDPADAARDAERVHVTLSDDAAVDAVLERARPMIPDGAVVCDHTTTSPTGTAERVARLDGKGLAYVHAPVFMGPQNAEKATGLMLISGDPARVARVRPALEAMTGKLLDLGPRPDRAASFKLMGNLFLMFLTTGLAEVLRLAKATGVPPEEAAALFRTFNPGTTVDARLQRMIAQDFGDASWNLAMARKDARLMEEEADRHGVALAVLPSIARLMDRYLDEGHAADDWTILAKDALTSS